MSNWNITSKPEDPKKFYGYLMYHEWFYEWDDIEAAFEDICELYRTKKWWDYDGFAMYEGVSNWMWGVNRPIDWKARLDDDQSELLAELKTANFNM